MSISLPLDALCDGLFGTGSHNDTHSNENLGYRALNVTIYGGISLGTYSRKYVAPLIFLSTCYHQALATVSADVSIWLEPVAKLVRGESMHMHPYYFQNIIYIFLTNFRYTPIMMRKYTHIILYFFFE